MKTITRRRSRKSLAAGFGLLILFLVSPYLLAPGLASQADAPFVPGAPGSISLGYSPSTLTPVQDGMPVYSLADKMWIESTASGAVTVNLISPSREIVTSITLQPSTVSLLYSFQAVDKEGTWELQVISNGGNNLLNINVVDPEAHGFPVNLAYYSLQNAQLHLGFNSSATPDYQLQACLIPRSGLATVLVPLPGEVGAGTLRVTLNGNTASLTAAGDISRPFSYWFELYYPYAYSNQNAAQFVTRVVKVGESTPELFSTSSFVQSANVTLNAALRTGRYTLRSFFESSNGLVVAEAKVLLQPENNRSAAWTWLDACNPFSFASGAPMQLQSNLTGAPSTWPAALCYMYNYEGVDGISSVPLNIPLAKIQFVSNPGKVPLTSLSFGSVKGAALNSWSAFQGTLYLAASSFPVALEVTPQVGRQQLQTLNLTLATAFANYTFSELMSRVSVFVENQGAAVRGASIQLVDTQNDTFSQTSGLLGNATFIVPAGDYEVQASYGELFQQQLVFASLGNSTRVVLTFVPAAASVELQWALVVLAVVGVLINLYVWVLRPRAYRY